MATTAHKSTWKPAMAKAGLKGNYSTGGTSHSPTHNLTGLTEDGDSGAKGGGGKGRVWLGVGKFIRYMLCAVPPPKHYAQ